MGVTKKNIVDVTSQFHTLHVETEKSKEVFMLKL